MNTIGCADRMNLKIAVVTPLKRWVTGWGGWV
jgi:hypothetical protein